ncbi:hypothetical protein A2U01_0115714, partial [Trifolium medium]|nr:hypothetical protein [Trifolium medium]
MSKAKVNAFSWHPSWEDNFEVKTDVTLPAPDDPRPFIASIT